VKQSAPPRVAASNKAALKRQNGNEGL